MNEALTKALEVFKKQYPFVTSGDLQTFVLNWTACEAAINEDLKNESDLNAMESQIYE